MSYCVCSLFYYSGIFFLFLIISLFLLKINLHRISNSGKLFLIQSAIFYITLLTWPFMIFHPKDYRNLLAPFKVLRKCGEFVGYDIEIRGEENVRPNKGGVIIINHQSTLDLLLLGHIWPLLGPVKIVVKKALFYYPFFGFVLWLSGFLFIDRKKGKTAINKLNTEINVIQEENYKLLIFPEGTRTLSEKIKEFRKGAFHIAIKSQSPIQPIVFSHYYFLRNDLTSTAQFNTIKNRIIISILPEVRTDLEFKTIDTVDDLIDKCDNQMQIEYTKINCEINNSKNQ